MLSSNWSNMISFLILEDSSFYFVWWSSFQVKIFSLCKRVMFQSGVSIIDFLWKDIWVHFGVKKLPFSLLKGLALNLEVGLFNYVLQYVVHLALSSWVTESALFKNEVLTVDGTQIIFCCVGSKLIVLLFLYLKSDFGSSSGMFDFS